jgi:homogentisate 1,2-dioxygenase
MPRYHTLGQIPPKRHTVFKDKNNNFYYEELFGTIGFDGMSTLMYHTQRPTQVKAILKSYDVAPKIAVSKNMKSLKLDGFKVAAVNDYLESRTCILANSDCQISLAAPKDALTAYFYKNTDSDEVLFIHKGSGTLRTHLGNINFKYGDYLVIPRGIIYQIEFNDTDNRLFIVNAIETGLVSTSKAHLIVNVTSTLLPNLKPLMRRVSLSSKLKNKTPYMSMCMQRTLLVWWVGTVIISPINFLFMTLSLLQG